MEDVMDFKPPTPNLHQKFIALRNATVRTIEGPLSKNDIRHLTINREFQRFLATLPDTVTDWVTALSLWITTKRPAEPWLFQAMTMLAAELDLRTAEQLLDLYDSKCRPTPLPFVKEVL
jgi:hypothetical protein